MGDLDGWGVMLCLVRLTVCVSARSAFKDWSSKARLVRVHEAVRVVPKF